MLTLNGHRWGIIGYANWIFRNQEAIVILLKSNTNETKENEPETEPKKLSFNEKNLPEKEPLSEKLAENVKFDGSQSDDVILDQSDQRSEQDQLDVDEIEKDCLSSISYLNVAIGAKECDTDHPLERG